MKEVDTNSGGRMDFQDFTLIIRQFIDLQAEEKMNKEKRAIEATGFSMAEVQDFRELFIIRDEDKDETLSWAEIKNLVGNICPLSSRLQQDLFKAFQEAQTAHATAGGAKQAEAIDF